MTNTKVKELSYKLDLDKEAIELLIDGYWNKIKNVPKRLHRYQTGLKWIPSCCDEAYENDIWLAEKIDFNWRLKQHNSAIRQKCTPAYFDGMYKKTYRNVDIYVQAVLDYNLERWNKYINKIIKLGNLIDKDTTIMVNHLWMTQKEKRSVSYFHKVGGQYK